MYSNYFSIANSFSLWFSFHSVAIPNVWARPHSTDWCSPLQSCCLSEYMSCCTTSNLLLCMIDLFQLWVTQLAWYLYRTDILLFSGVTKWTTTTQPRTSWPCASRTTTTVALIFTDLACHQTICTTCEHLLEQQQQETCMCWLTVSRPQLNFWGQLLSSPCCHCLVAAFCKQ